MINTEKCFEMRYKSLSKGQKDKMTCAVRTPINIRFVMFFTEHSTKGIYPNNSYVEVLANLEYWHIKKSKYNITRDSQDLRWCPKHNMNGKFDGMYMNHLANKHD